MDEPEKDQWLVTYSYKGHANSVVLKVVTTVHAAFEKRKIRGGIDEIYAPGEWHYDPVTCCPVPGEKKDG